MNIQDIPLIIPNFNQLTYLRNLINWWKWYYPNNPVYVIDNGSTYEPLHQLYLLNHGGIEVIWCQENDFVSNLRKFLDKINPEYYVISDPDIMPHPATPFNFLEIFKSIIDAGYHHVGFDLITNDLPEWNKKAGWIQGDELALHGRPQRFEYDGNIYEGFKAALDTTFCLFKRENGGWTAPMSAENWSSSIRLFNAFHLSWYLDAAMLNDEMKHYYATCKRFEPGQISAGSNNHRPE